MLPRLSKAAVGLTHQARDSPSCHHTVEALSLGGTNDIHHLVLSFCEPRDQRDTRFGCPSSSLGLCKRL